jgi:hypothetical protein
VPVTGIIGPAVRYCISHCGQNFTPEYTLPAPVT